MVRVTGTLNHNYDKLMEKIKAITILQSAEDIINWDMETKMPPKGIDLRSEQLAMISLIGHNMITDPCIGTLLEKIEAYPDFEMLDKTRMRNMYLIRKKYDEETKLPEKLVKETAKQRAITIKTWKNAKAAKNFSMYRLDLEKLCNFKKEAAAILMDVKKTRTQYDALIDIYEPKMTSEMITKIFNKLKDDLKSIIYQCQTANKEKDRSIMQRKVPLEMQKRITNKLAKFIEYDVESENAGGRIDETEHPFTTGYYNDVRVTTHYYEKNLLSSIFSILHEGGHALYEQNLKPEWMYQPIGSSCSLGFHESQSRLLENIIGRSPEFWTYFFPKLKEITENIFSDVCQDKIVFAINQVEPSKIRIEADEVTYCLHVIIRFEIERDLMSGKITVSELPVIWNQKYKDYLDVDVENDSEGVMQDTHWASGSIGYFPTYALGNIYSGQILHQIEKDIVDWRRQILEGNFHNVKQWLNENIYSFGNLYDPVELLKKITGEEINSTYYIDYLKEKYANTYGF